MFNFNFRDQQISIEETHQYHHQRSEVDKIVTRRGGLNCDPLKIIL